MSSVILRETFEICEICGASYFILGMLRDRGVDGRCRNTRMGFLHLSLKVTANFGGMLRILRGVVSLREDINCYR